MERRLAAIVAADVVGNSRLIGADETGMLKAINTHRKKLNEPKLRQYYGRAWTLVRDQTLS